MPNNNENNQNQPPRQLPNGTIPRPEEKIIASVRWRSSQTPQLNKCFGCGAVCSSRKGQSKLLCGNCLWLRNKYQKQAQKWWFKLKEDEKKQLVEAKNPEQLEKVWQEANDRRNFWTSSFFLVLFSLIFFSWNKFWSWYERPVKKEWDWAEENEDEEQAKPEPEPEEKPKPLKGWKRIKNWVLDNKIRLISLIGIIWSGLSSVIRIVKLVK